MYYDRPRKKQKNSEVRIREEEIKNKRIEEKRREKKKSLFSFFFETPVHAPKGYEEDERAGESEHQAPKKKKSHFLLKTAALLMTFCALAVFLLYLLPVGAFGSNDKDLYLANHSMPSGYVHVLLVGADMDSTGTSRSDTMIIASVSKDGVKLTSLMRDTGVTIPGRSGTHRLNAAYAYGGIDLLIQTINENFSLNITRYAMVDYESFPKIIDAIGGVKLSITNEEANEINNNVKGLLYMQVKAGKREYNAGYQMYLDEILPAGGESIHLDGLQTLGYARIRNLDSDYGRTSRQRKVLSALIGEAKQHPLRLIGAAGEALSVIETNMNALEIASIAIKAVSGGLPEQNRLPAPETYTDNGGMFTNVNYSANRQYFIDFVYGNEY